MITLRKSPVVFNEEEHRYFLNGKELKGVTSTLIRRALPTQHARGMSCTRSSSTMTTTARLQKSMMTRA